MSDPSEHFTARSHLLDSGTFRTCVETQLENARQKQSQITGIETFPTRQKQRLSEAAVAQEDTITIVFPTRAWPLGSEKKPWMRL